MAFFLPSAHAGRSPDCSRNLDSKRAGRSDLGAQGMTDALYRSWVQKQGSWSTGNFSEYLDDGRKLCVAAHVRWAGPSGIGFKAAYSCVPLTQTEHAYQHQHGELACLMKFSRDPQLKSTLMNASPFEAERIAQE